MIKQLYPTYFQKSKVFLYPLLGLSKSAVHKPLNTYLSCETVFKLDDYKLLLTYDISNSNNKYPWYNFRSGILSKRKNYYDYKMVEGTNVGVVIFDYESFKDDYEAVIAGKYSKISANSKELIKAYYGINSPEWAYVESFLYPEAYYDTYAKLLNVEIELLEKVGQLVDLPNFNKEQFVGKLQPASESINFVNR